jgi:putative phosphoribosyl transferase
LLRERADDVIVLECPEQLRAIGEFYDDFTQLGDDEVVAILDRAWSR